MRRRILAFFTVLVMLLSLFAPFTKSQVNAASKNKSISTVKVGTKITVGNLNYKVTKLSKKGGEVKVTGVKKKTAAVSIPASYKLNVKKGKYKGVLTMRVTSIAPKAFMDNMKLSKLTIGSNVKTIGAKAFYKAMNLRSVNLGKNVETISDYAFTCDYNLVSVNVPSGSALKSIGKCAFKNCVKLKIFNFKNAPNLTKIGASAFAYCDRLSNTPKDKTPEYQSILAKVKKYKYSVSPLLAEHNSFFYLKTDYPNPEDIRLVDKSSAYYDKDSSYDILSLEEQRFIDVQYENKTTGRVKGGYIFKSKSATTDGGELTLEINTAELDPMKESKKWVDTGITVKCSKVMNATNYLMTKYTNLSMSFFEKLDSIESALTSISLYPKGIYDSSKRNEGKYPSLCTSPYQELSLNEHYESIYQKADERPLFYWMYPYVMDSLGFPGTMSSFAKKFNPNCKVESGGVHYLIKVTSGGVTKYYGGAGNGSTDEFYTSAIGKNFTFDGSKSDLGTDGTLDGFISAYKTAQTKSSQIISGFREQLSGNTYKSKIGNGTWIRAGREGGGRSYCYITKGQDFSNSEYVHVISNMWVDGRYINSWEFAEKGTSFADHPTANIMVRNMTYKTYQNETITGDVVFAYDKDSGTWKSDAYYKKKGTSYITKPKNVTLPDEFILSPDEVKAMGVDRNKDTFPTTGLIYDGTAEPGTPFNNSGTEM